VDRLYYVNAEESTGKQSFQVTMRQLRQTPLQGTAVAHSINQYSFSDEISCNLTLLDTTPH